MFRPIPVGLTLVADEEHAPQDQFDIEQGDELTGLELEELVKLTYR